MRRIVGVAAVAMVLAGCGDARAATRSYQVSGFSRLRVTGPFDVRVRTGAAASVRATGPQAKIDRLTVEQRGDVVDIGTVRNAGWSLGLAQSQEPLVVEVTVPSLSGVALTGSGDVTVDRVRGDALDLALSGSGDVTVGAAAVRQLRIRLTGSGDLTVAGTAETAAASLQGPGNVVAGKLTAGTAVVDLTGSGDIALAARRTAKVTLTGSGDVTITGGARCAVTKTGSGDVSCAGGTGTGE